jgi:hypothetical protein
VITQLFGFVVQDRLNSLVHRELEKIRWAEQQNAAAQHMMLQAHAVAASAGIPSSSSGEYSMGYVPVGVSAPAVAQAPVMQTPSHVYDNGIVTSHASLSYQQPHQQSYVQSGVSGDYTFAVPQPMPPAVFSAPSLAASIEHTQPSVQHVKPTVSPRVTTAQRSPRGIVPLRPPPFPAIVGVISPSAMSGGSHAVSHTNSFGQQMTSTPSWVHSAPRDPQPSRHAVFY